MPNLVFYPLGNRRVTKPPDYCPYFLANFPFLCDYSSLGTSENHVFAKFVLVKMETAQSNYDFSWGSDGRPL